MTDTPTSPNKKLFIKTWGCQMNVYDSQRMADILRPFGYRETGQPDDADMIILNTCHIREKATEKVFSELGRLREHKQSGQDDGRQPLLAVAGCVAQADGELIAERAPYVDMVFGPQTYHKLAEMVADATDAYGKNRVINTDFPVEQKFDFLPEEREPAGASAFVSIQEGCDKFCTFCVVPYTRGAEYSRDVDQIVAECQAVIRAGAKEIQLLGQNVNAYHGTGPDGATWNLAQLIRQVADKTDIERIRYTTSHPRDMDDDLIAAHGEVEQLMPMLHLPVQSGSDGVLKRMNRQHTADDYRRIIDDLRSANPDMVFSSDFIVGFPGETDADFEDTMQLVRDIGFASAYSFAYSPRPGTPAANMKKLVPKKIQKERLHRLQDLLTTQQIEFNQSTIGRQLDVLFDREGKEDGQLLGRTPYMQSIYATAPKRLMNEIIKVEVTGAYRNSVSGKIVTHDIETGSSESISDTSTTRPTMAAQ